MKKWPEDEVTRAINLLKTSDPALWERYIEGEKLRNSIDEDTSWAMKRIILRSVFPEEKIFSSPMVMDVVGLLASIRDRVRAELGLHWEKGNLAAYKPK